MGNRKESTFIRYLLKWLLLLFAGFAGICVLFSILTYYREQVYYSEVIDEGQRGRIDYLARNLNDEISKIKVTANVILSEDTILDLCCLYGWAGSFEKNQLITAVRRRCMEIVNLNTFVKNASFYLLSEEMKITKEGYEYVDSKEPMHYARMEKQGGILAVEDGTGYIVEVLNKDFMDEKWAEDNILGIFVVELDSGVISNELEYARLTEKDILLITSQDYGEVYFATRQIDPSLVGRFGQTVEIDGSVYQPVKTGSAQHFFRLYYLKEQSFSRLMRQKLIVNILLFTAVILLSLLMVGVLYYRKVFRPLEILLVDAFGQIKRSNLSYRIPDTGTGVFSDLYRNFNFMAERIDTLVSRELKQQILVNQANFKHLQAQINPHFMYNSYFLLYRLIKGNDREAGLAVCENLGKFFKYITRDSSDMKSLSDEVSHAKSYAVIQGYRFRGMIQIAFEELPQEYGYIEVPRLILQPVVENVFKYVVNEMEPDDEVMLQVTYFEDGDHLVIQLENSGKITQESLELVRRKIREPKTGEEVTALVNINSRLNVCFAQERSVEVFRSPLGGMAVQIRVKL